MKRKLKNYRGKLTVKEKIWHRIQELDRISSRSVFVPNDFFDISTYPQRQRALKELIEEEKITRLGYGVYAKLVENSINFKKRLKETPLSATKKIFNIIGVKFENSEQVKKYNLRKTTQVPVSELIKIVGNKKFNRYIPYIEKVYAH